MSDSLQEKNIIVYGNSDFLKKESIRLAQNYIKAIYKDEELFQNLIIYKFQIQKENLAKKFFAFSRFDIELPKEIFND